MPSGNIKRENRKNQSVVQDTPQSRAMALKQKGNSYFSIGDIDQAISYYSEAIGEDDGNYKIFSNRALCFGKTQDFNRMLEDATKCTELAPNWAKGYFRKGKALEGLLKFTAAQKEYLKAVELEPGNPTLESVVKQIEKRLKAITFNYNKAVGGT